MVGHCRSRRVKHDPGQHTLHVRRSVRRSVSPQRHRSLAGSDLWLVTICFLGARDRSRTCDLLFTRQLLCQLSYSGLGLGYNAEGAAVHSNLQCLFVSTQ